MLFNSVEFIFFFFPLSLLVFLLLKRADRHGWAQAFLISASLVFYSWWSVHNLLLFSASIIGNYAVGVFLGRLNARNAGSQRRLVLAAGIAANLGCLGYYKYGAFFTGAVNQLWDSVPVVGAVALPLAISFFTFEQISFLVNRYRGVVGTPSFLDYAMFVTFFPHLIAGPIVLSHELIDQCDRKTWRCPDAVDLSIAGTLIALGLAKKVLLGDTFGGMSDRIFNSVAAYPPTMIEAWLGALSFTLQIYFDFSGYSDMAVGLARAFGIRLPFNFDSPYQATSIVAFWRRWHITLSRFLRDYLYFPLGGSRRGPLRRYANLLLVMLLGGLWHGAGWTFVAWGGLHGVFLGINHAWRHLWGQPVGKPHRLASLAGWALTMVAVVAAWVFFRATSFVDAVTVLKGMIGAHGVVLPATYERLMGGLSGLGVRFDADFTGTQPYRFYGMVDTAWLGLGIVVTTLLPNTAQLVGRYLNRKTRPVADATNVPVIYRPAGPWRPAWRPTALWGVTLAVLILAITISMNVAQSFIYFEF